MSSNKKKAAGKRKKMTPVRRGKSLPKMKMTSKHNRARPKKKDNVPQIREPRTKFMDTFDAWLAKQPPSAGTGPHASESVSLLTLSTRDQWLKSQPSGRTEEARVEAKKPPASSFEEWMARSVEIRRKQQQQEEEESIAVDYVTEKSPSNDEEARVEEPAQERFESL